MDLIIMPTQSGKTKLLIEAMAANPDAIYVAATRWQADAAWARAVATGQPFAQERFLSVEQLQGNPMRYVKGRNPEAYVDELEAVLEAALQFPVAKATFSPPDLYAAPVAKARPSNLTELSEHWRETYWEVEQ